MVKKKINEKEKDDEMPQKKFQWRWWEKGIPLRGKRLGIQMGHFIDNYLTLKKKNLNLIIFNQSNYIILQIPNIILSNEWILHIDVSNYMYSMTFIEFHSKQNFTTNKLYE